MVTLLLQIKAHALANYDNGWDFVVECYSDDDILTECRENNIISLAAYIKRIEPVIEIREERQPREGWDY